jgi:hypothetical protein
VLPRQDAKDRSANEQTISPCGPGCGGAGYPLWAAPDIFVDILDPKPCTRTPRRARRAGGPSGENRTTGLRDHAIPQRGQPGDRRRDSGRRSWRGRRPDRLTGEGRAARRPDPCHGRRGALHRVQVRARPEVPVLLSRRRTADRRERHYRVVRAVAPPSLALLRRGLRERRQLLAGRAGTWSDPRPGDAARGRSG